jgi:hypothetical protein
MLVGCHIQTDTHQMRNAGDTANHWATPRLLMARPLSCHQKLTVLFKCLLYPLGQSALRVMHLCNCLRMQLLLQQES